MHDTTVRYSYDRPGLTDEDQKTLAAAQKCLPRWSLSFEMIDCEDVYACIIPPWNKHASAFLIDREGHRIILTDNISDNFRPVITAWSNLQDAVNHVLRLATGIECMDPSAAVADYIQGQRLK